MIAAAVAVCVALGASYVLADVHDLVPGPLTDDPTSPTPAPFPSALTVVPVSAVSMTSLNAEAPMPSAAAVQALADQLDRDPRVGRSTGVSVVDIATGTVLADVAASDPQVPASNEKLLTAAAVTIGVDPALRLRTTVVLNQSASSSSAQLTLVAGGDMLLAADHGHGGSQRGAVGFAGLGDLADQVVTALAEKGIATVEVVVDDSAFEGPSIPSGWPSYAISGGYASAATGLAVNVGKVTDGEIVPRYPDPSMNAGEVFAARLNDRGVAVSRVTRGDAGEGDVVVATVESAPIGDVVEYMLEVSENTLAEVLVMILAVESGQPGTTAAGLAQMAVTLEGAGLDLTGVRMDDGSGFTATDRVPPQVLTHLLVLLATNATYDDMLERLPVSGLRGTLWDRYVTSDAAGVVRAKTGSLTGVTALSGTVVTADGRWLAFSVLADGMPAGQVRPRAAVDEFVAALAACGCS